MASSPVGTSLPQGCSAIPQRKLSAGPSYCSSPPNSSPKNRRFSARSPPASASSTSRRCVAERTARSSTSRSPSKIARDITERRQAEAALFESERLAAIGRMAASIAHEVNNPLEAILNISYLLSQNPSLDQEARDYTQLLLSEVVRVSEITKQTLSFYRETSDAVEIDMGSLLENILKLHSPMLQQKSIRVRTHFRPARICARQGDLRQVFTNLIINAVDALPSGGEINVSVSRPHHQNAVCVTIADNGTGIPENVRPKIFHPFFTTKPSRGTGLGLWVSQGIVRKYGGSIRMRTTTAPAAKTGTIFRVCLPSHL